MGIKTRLAAASLGAAFATAGLAGTAAATANAGETAPAGGWTAATQSQSNASTSGNVSAKGKWEYYSWYWTYAKCHAVGKEKVKEARWTDYDCRDHASDVTVLLYLKKK